MYFCIIFDFKTAIKFKFSVNFQAYHSTRLEENFLFQDVWLHNILTKVLYNNNNFNITLILSTLYTGVVTVYWQCAFYHLQLPKLYANAVYVF